MLLQSWRVLPPPQKSLRDCTFDNHHRTLANAIIFLPFALGRGNDGCAVNVDKTCTI